MKNIRLIIQCIFMVSGVFLKYSLIKGLNLFFLSVPKLLFHFVVSGVVARSENSIRGSGLSINKSFVEFSDCQVPVLSA